MENSDGQTNEINEIIDNCYINYPTDDDETIMKKITDHNCDKTYVEQFADDLNVSKCNDEIFLRIQLIERFPSKDEDFKYLINSHNLGNLAYLANHSIEPYNEIAYKLYDKLVRTICNDTSLCNSEISMFDKKQKYLILFAGVTIVALFFRCVAYPVLPSIE